MNDKQSIVLDAVVVGAGFAGLYTVHRLRDMGLDILAFERGGDVGGVWYWNRYPGARCDCESQVYSFTFSEALYKEWTWSSRYPEQPEILRYLNFVADRFDLRRSIRFNTTVEGARFDEQAALWRLELSSGEKVAARYLITGVGCLSATNVPPMPGLAEFKGEWHHTGDWPKQPVDFSGKRVAVIGTGSSGIQSIPVIATQAAHLTVFQRTPQYTVPARDRPLTKNEIAQLKADFAKTRAGIYESWGGEIFPQPRPAAMQDSAEQRNELYEQYWDEGGHGLVAATYADLLIDADANKTAADFIRDKIRSTVHDAAVAEKLLPTTYYGTKRPILDTQYYETYNRDNVALVDLRATPIEKITPTGIDTTDAHYDLDAIVFATGYDSMTGALFKMNIRGRDGRTLRETWENGAKVRTYLGLSTAGFPNLFMITGPESPSVLCNMPTAVEQHVDWIAQYIDYAREHGVRFIEATADAQETWSAECDAAANQTLYPHTPSWYTSANIKGKPRGRFPIYLGGFPVYQDKCRDVAAKGYDGFALSPRPA